MAVSELSGGLWRIEPLWGELEELLGCPFALFGGGLGKGGAEGDAQAGGPSERSTELHGNYQDNPMKQTGKPVQRRDAENAEDTQRKARTRWPEGAGFSPCAGGAGPRAGAGVARKRQMRRCRHALALQGSKRRPRSLGIRLATRGFGRFLPWRGGYVHPRASRLG